MAKFNNTTARSRNGIGPITSTPSATATTFNGARGFDRDSKSELFLAAVSDFGGENTFYESGKERTNRIARLTHEVALSDPEWLKGFTNWLRNEANMRTVSLTIALEGAKALNKAKVPGGRQLVAGAIRRADEPGEALAWWMANEGRKIPSAVKRGIADAVVNTFNEYSLAKYDTPSHGFRFGDVIELVHPTPKGDKQSDVFKFALDRRRDASAEPSDSLTLLQNRAKVMALSPEEKRKLVESKDAAETLKGAGLTWEALSGSLAGGMDAKAWEAVIPSMGYMALIRNLRNFEKAGVSEVVLNGISAKLADRDEVAKSRQLPFRFLSAYRAVTGITTQYDYWTGRKTTVATGSLRFAYPLEKALNHSLANVPELDGNTLILVDRSGSMFGNPSKNTDLSFADSAAVFGSALALRAKNATLVEFGTDSKEIPFSKAGSILKVVESFNTMGGTNTALAIRKHFKKGIHTRVVLITDEQTNSYYGNDLLDAIPSDVPVYTWNLVGYSKGQGESKPNRTFLGGLSDQAFRLIPLLERGTDAGWPWELS